jgi:HEAT repeat protein
MRHILQIRLQHAWRLVLPAVLISALLAMQPARANADPVNDLRLALNADQKELMTPDQAIVEYRRVNLQKKVDNLRTIADLWGALALKDWKDDLSKVGTRIQTLDSDARRQVGLRLTKAIDDVVDHGDANSRLAAANSIAEKGPTIRSLSTVASTVKGDQVVMGDAGGFVRTLTPQVIRLAEDKNLGVRQEALRALGNIFAKPQQVVPVFKRALETDVAGLKRLAADGLGQLIRVVSHLRKQERTSSGVEAYGLDVLDAVVGALGANRVGLADNDVQVRVLCLHNIREAAEALSELIKEPQKEIGNLEVTKDFPPPDRPVTALEKKLIMGNHEVIAREISDFLPALKALAAQQEALARGIKDTDSRVRLAAAEALENIGTARFRLKKRVLSVPVVESGGDFGNRDALVKNDVLETFIHNNLESIANLLTDSNVALRKKGVEFLDIIEEAAAPAFPALVKRLGDADKFVRWSAARAIANFSPDLAAGAVPGLAKLLSDPDLDVRLTAAKTLMEIGPQARSAVPALAAAANDGDAEARLAAMEALQRIGPEAGKAAVPKLIQALGNGDTRVRRAAAKTLGSFGPAAFAAIPSLRRALGDDDQEVRVNASDAMLDILQRREKY